VLSVALAAALALVVPWTPLPGAELVGDPLRDFTAAERAREVAFHREVRPWSYASLAVGLLVSVLLGLTRAGARLVTAVARPLGGGWAWQVLLGTLAVTALGRLVTLPLSARAEAVRRDYGLSTRTWAGWLADVGKGSAGRGRPDRPGAAGAGRGGPPGSPHLVGLGCRRHRGAGGGRLLRLPAGGGAGLQRLHPLPAGELRSDLLALAERDGVPVDEVWSPTRPGGPRP
jgi:STE24 endopeptidase